MYTSTVQSAPSTNVALSPHPRLQTSYPPSSHFISPPSALLSPSLAPGCPSTPPASSPPDSLRVLQWNAGALNYFAFFRPILSTLSASRNTILTHLPLSEFLDSLLCALIAPTPGLWHSLS